MRRRLWTAMLVTTLAAGAALGAAQPEPAAKAKGVPGKVVAVTLYRTQATVTRTVPVEAAAGPVELLVSGLPQHTVPESLFAEAGPGIEVRAVRFRTRAVKDEPRPEVRKLEDQIEAVQAKITRNKKMQGLITKRLGFPLAPQGHLGSFPHLQEAGLRDLEACPSAPSFLLPLPRPCVRPPSTVGGRAQKYPPTLPHMKRLGP